MACGSPHARGADIPSGSGGTVDALETYLMELGLKDLAVSHLEGRLQAENQKAARTLIGRRLSTLLVEAMLAAEEESGRAAAAREKLVRLVETIKELNSPEVGVMLLQARYQEAEGLVEAWLLGETEIAGDEAERESLVKRFAVLSKELNLRVDQLSGRLLAMEDRSIVLRNPAEMLAHEKTMDLMEGVVRRARYFAGWTNYYTGLLSHHPVSMANGAEDFRWLLGINSGSELKPIGLDDFYRARMVLGLGMCVAGAGEVSRGLDYCETLRTIGANEAVVEELDLWIYRLMIEAGDVASVIRYAKKRLDDDSFNAQRGRVAMCVSMVHAGANAAVGAADEQNELVTLGVNGLLKMGRVQVLQILMNRYGLEVGHDSGFVMQWLEAQQQYSDARKLNDGFAAVATALQKALQAEGVERYPQAADQCRYLLAWCLYLDGDVEKATKMFRQLAQSMQSHDPKTAGDAAWMAVEGYRQLAQADVAYVVLGIEALDAYEASFPNHKQITRARYLRGQFHGLEDDRIDALALFESVNPNDPDYLMARYNIVQTHYQQWSRIRNKGGDRATAAGRLLLLAADRLLNAPNVNNEPAMVARTLGQGLQVGLWLAKNAAEFNGENRNGLDQYAQRLRNMAEGDTLSPELKVESRYRLLEWAESTENLDEMRQLASWLWEHGAKSGYGLKGLVLLSGMLERSIGQGAAGDPSGANRMKRLEELVIIYERMLTITGDSADVLERDQTARVASYRLGGALYFLERYAASALIFQKLISVFEDDRRYLQMGAMAHYQAGLHREAVDYWRVLLPGLISESDEWYEAKHYHLLSLIEFDPDRAAAVYGQFVLLHPQLGGPEYADRFEQLGNRMSVTRKGESP